MNCLLQCYLQQMVRPAEMSAFFYDALFDAGSVSGMTCSHISGYGQFMKCKDILRRKISYIQIFIKA